MVRDFQSMIGREAANKSSRRNKTLPTHLFRLRRRRFDPSAFFTNFLRDAM